MTPGGEAPKADPASRQKRHEALGGGEVRLLPRPLSTVYTT
ncbi:hypothetical protein SEA_ADUMB2043_69 [Arthrobacter phage Adumb2043]|nr:hypothetical protein SEA_ADUMB2043_69 [Arthrobacter phage Adumb2043]